MVQNKHKTAVVIPNWNGEDFLRECLDSLLQQTLKIAIVVVENGSTDGSDKILASYGNKIVVLKQATNLGFAGGVNVGIRYAIDNGFDYVALFNNDAVADTKWAEELAIAADERPAYGMITGKLLHIDDDRLDSTGDFYTIFGLPFPRGRNELDEGQYDYMNEVFGASGGATLYRVATLNEIGSFDEDFFAYFEDVDISFRAQLQGWKIYYQPTARAYHHISGTGGKISGFGTYQTAKNFWMIYTKNMPGVLYFKYLPLATYWYIRMFIGSIIHKKFIPFGSGWLRSMQRIPALIKKRREIQKRRKVSIKYIDNQLIKSTPKKS